MMNNYTVIGYYASNNQIFAHAVNSDTQMGAFSVVASQYSDAVMVCVLEGDIHEGESLGFPGDGIVDAETILEQPEVFGGSPEVKTPKVLEIMVIAYGPKSEHKVKAALDTDEIVTFYVEANTINVHSFTSGGLGNMYAGDYAHPEVLAQLKEAYKEHTL
jgi:hypothetical protein